MSEFGVLQEPAVSAQNFRFVLSALSRPGTLQTLPQAIDPPSPLLGVAACVAVTLCDYQSPVWLSASLNTSDVRKFLRFQTGAPLVTERAAPLFAFMTMAEACDDLDGFALGTHEYPDRSTTLVIQCDGFKSEMIVKLSGPGLKVPTVCGVAGATEKFWLTLQNNSKRFPLGWDVLFVTQDQVMGLPRSTRIKLPGDV
jgi:alpha-D-ribose 1-methylphosphonate 5-triphosphate synthase subunit PhnH